MGKVESIFAAAKPRVPATKSLSFTLLSEEAELLERLADGESVKVPDLLRAIVRSFLKDATTKRAADDQSPV